MKHIKLFEEYTNNKMFDKIPDSYNDISEELIEIISGWNEKQNSVKSILEKCAFMMDSLGVEEIRSENFEDKFWMDTVALYVNMTDEHKRTIFYDVPNKEFKLISLSKWFELNQDKYKIKEEII